MKSHDHLIHIDETKHELIIYRIDADARRTLYTAVPLPSDKAQLKSFAQQLGENLLMDSPVARKLLEL